VVESERLLVPATWMGNCKVNHFRGASQPSASAYRQSRLANGRGATAVYIAISLQIAGPNIAHSGGASLCENGLMDAHVGYCLGLCND
jgi:hypothetical protein